MDYIEEILDEYPDAIIDYNIHVNENNHQLLLNDHVPSKIDQRDRQTWKHSKYKHGLNKFK